MATAKVFGSMNGIELVFRLTDTGIWQVPVPAVPDGKYVVEVFAEDEAGNISYVAKYFYTFDSSNLIAVLEPSLWQSDILEEEFAFAINISDYVSDVQCEFATTLLPSEFIAEVEGDYDKATGISSW